VLAADGTSQLSSPASDSWFARNPPPGPASEPEVSPDDETAPLPVVLPDRPANGHVRGPFEPATRSPDPLAAEEQAPPKPRPDPQPGAPVRPPEPAVPGSAKLDQIKDLYLTAEAIGENALDTHFQQVSDRQRQLIKEYFDQATGDRAAGNARSPGP